MARRARAEKTASKKNVKLLEKNGQIHVKFVKRKYFRRERVVYFALALALFLIVVKLAQVQLINASEVRAKGAQLQAMSPGVATPERGSILDAQGHVLASSIEERQIYLDPSFLREFIGSERNTQSWTLESVAETLAQMLSLDKEVLVQELGAEKKYVLIAPSVDLALAQQVSALNIDGVVTTRATYRRSYPMQSFAAGTLGIVQQDGNGAEGLEYSYNDDLLGKKGSVYSLQLTLDSTIQFLIEQEMTKMIDEYKPQRVSILAMDPMTGRILGNGSYPSFDPNNYARTEPELRKNLAVSMTYEPGSVFKIVTGSAALEEAVITQHDVFDDPGFLRVGPLTITNWDSNMNSRGSVTFAEGMSASSNVVMAQVAQRLGKEKFFTYLRSFGFGERSGIDLPGEEIGQLIDEAQAREIEMATMSFGQANLVTPVQMLSAICAVANGGKIYTPYIVESVIDEKGKVVRKNTPQVQRQILSQETCDIMNDILVDVVDQGTGSRAKIKGIKVAGKTGTAQKINPRTKEYYTDNHIVSFGAYAPADEPKIALLVVVDNPRGSNVQGGHIAAPAAKTILEGALRYWNVPVDQESVGDVDDVVPPVTETAKPIQVKPERPPVSGEACVPNLKGLTMQQAGQELSRLGLRFSFSGSGLVTEQSPAPGKIVNIGDQVNVTFSSRGP